MKPISHVGYILLVKGNHSLQQFFTDLGSYEAALTIYKQRGYPVRDTAWVKADDAHSGPLEVAEWLSDPVGLLRKYHGDDHPMVVAATR